MSEMFTPADMTGRLFDRQAENTSTKQPHYTGQAVINGVQYRVSLWRNPPSERCKVATCSLKFETEEQYQQRIDQNRARSERRSQTKQQRQVGYSETKYPRY